MTEFEKKNRENEVRIRRNKFVERVYGEYLKAKKEDEESRMGSMRSFFRRAWELSKGDFYLFQKAFKDFEYETLRDIYHYESKSNEDNDEFGLGGYRFATFNTESHTELRQITDMREGTLYSRSDGEFSRITGTDIERMLPMELLRLCDEMKFWKEVKLNRKRK